MSDILCIYYSRTGHTRRAVKEIAEAMGLTYLCESWFRANQAFDRFRRQGDRREVTHPDHRRLRPQRLAGIYALRYGRHEDIHPAPAAL